MKYYYYNEPKSLESEEQNLINLKPLSNSMSCLSKSLIHLEAPGPPDLADVAAVELEVAVLVADVEFTFFRGFF
jgi:hypothetical protein